MTLERIQPDGLAKLPLFTQVVKAGNTVYIAGQPALDSRGQLVGPGDITAQATQVFDNIGIALKSVGASFDNLVKMTIFATDRAHLAPIAEVRASTLAIQTRSRAHSLKLPAWPGRRCCWRSSRSRSSTNNICKVPSGATGLRVVPFDADTGCTCPTARSSAPP
jgi:enamine deaminase RidA (YjgF/YER057c/UK114 family)